MFDTVKILLILSYVLILFVNNSEGILCYRCSATPEPTGNKILPCSKFDWSPKFEIDCPQSTLCMKRTFTIPLGEEIHSVARDCAQQTYDGQNYNFAIRQWVKNVTIVEAAYKEGCHAAEDIGRPGHPTTYCFCSNAMCNKSYSFRDISSNFIILNLAGTLVCMLAKY